MHSIHGTWIPDDTHEFIQRGAFYLWVETDTLQDVSRHDSMHPRHLMHTALSTFLAEKLGLQVSSAASALSGPPLDTKCFLLPTAEGMPSPSFELLRYVEEEEPIEFALQPWQICCYQVADIITTLNDIHFVALNHPEDFQLGTDLLFWQQYTQALKTIIAKDQYIPALKYREIPVVPTKGKRAKKNNAPTFELHPAWELLSDTYETIVRRYSAAMPGICAAGLNGSDNAALFAKEPLLRHFSECLLNTIVTGTPFTGKFDQQIANTLLYNCVYPYRPTLLQTPPDTLDDYKYWLAWRTNLTRAHTEASFTLCFRLEEASASAIDDWQLHFLVAARHDPSLKLSLDEYWHLSAKARAEAVRPFGQDFEKNLLLALGYAARIYPTIWHGLATDRPTECHLTLEEAFAFLKESAWVLGEAGYTVIVPAWWTPEGRRRTKVRLKTTVRGSKGSASLGSGHLDLQTIISYRYQLSVGGQIVTEEEWQQLVNAKTSLVQFRGEWMELDREKMQQLLQFWQTHQGEEPEITLLDLLKIGTESEDDLEWEHDQLLQGMLARLQDKNAFAPIENPRDLQGTLRSYQSRGVAWLQYLESLGLNPCLADDMGLGKTLEVIAHLLKERESVDGVRPTLVIAPTSVLGNWRKEIERFAPQLRTLVHQGSARLKEKQPFVEAC
ncbi:MAG TPA: SNF2 helicase-associated domain-containing protein, partial [Ktedonobacteraceae bacterium]